MPDKPNPPHDAKAAAKAAREARLARALRDNLRRRKAPTAGKVAEKQGSAPAGPTKPDKP
jgi:hypothetical protein